jgi:hypothetical protein
VDGLPLPPRAPLSFAAPLSGDKRREFSTFAPLLKSGDIIGAHDLYVGADYWAWSEITEADVADVCERHELVRLMQEEFAPAGWLMRRKA